MKSPIRKTMAISLGIALAFFNLLAPSTAQTSPEDSAQEERYASFNASLLAADSNAASDAARSRITLELKGVDILDVLKVLSTHSGMNIVAGSNVRGPVTIYLKDVSARDALETLVSILGLAYEEDQGIIRVMSSKEYENIHGRPFRDRRISRTFKLKHADSETVNQIVQQLKGPTGKALMDERTHTLIVSDYPQVVRDIQQAIKVLDEPLVTKVIKLNFASVTDLEPQLQSYLTPEKGILKGDKRTNQISVTDQRERVERIVELVRSLDVRPPQVLIEAQIIEVDLFDAFRYGIDWDYIHSKANLNPTFDLAVPAAALGAGSLSTFTISEGISGLKTVVSLLQNVGKTNTLSSPRVTVVNNEEAKLTDATRQPYVAQTVVQGETTSQTADNVQFVDIGITLSVVPTISDKNTVVLKLKPEVSTQSGTLSVSSVSQSSNTQFTRIQIPIVDTQTLETTVIVKSGETLIVGGLIKDANTKVLRKLPFLGDIPFFGALFRSSTFDFHKTELVIFLTPYIISGDVSSREYQRYFDAKGDLIHFDKVGGYDFELAQKHSEGPLRRDNDSYWERTSLEFPRYGAPTDVYTRTEPYRDRMNEFENFQEGKLAPDKNNLRRAYEISVNQQVHALLGSLEALKGLKERIDLALLIRRDGALKDVSLINTAGVRDEKLRRLILQTVRQASRFSEFPKGLDSEQELFEVQFQFQEGEPNGPA